MPQQYCRMMYSLVGVNIAVLVVAMIHVGCSHNKVSEKPPSLENVETDIYILEVMEPPVEGRLRVEKNYRWGDGPYAYWDLSMEPTGTNPFSFFTEIRRDVQPQFSVWVDFDPGQCHDPKDEFYCGPVRLFTNHPYYSDNGEIEEVGVVLKASMSNALKGSAYKYECADGVSEVELWEWQPVFCKYEILNQADF